VNNREIEIVTFGCTCGKAEEIHETPRPVKGKVKISLLQAVEAYRVARG
jgi:hypothetical protein